MRGLLLAAATSVTLVAQQVDPQALQRMVATERAFAAATERDRRARRIPHVLCRRRGVARCRARPERPRRSAARRTGSLRIAPLPKLPVLARLMWEPFTGQMSERRHARLADRPRTSCLNQLVEGHRGAKARTSACGSGRPTARGACGSTRASRCRTCGATRASFARRPSRMPARLAAQGETLDDAERAVAAGGEAWRRAARGLDAPPPRRRDADGRPRRSCANGPRRRGPA